MLGTGTWVGVALKRNSRRKALKREILELGVRLQVEKLKYPKWFQDAHIQKIENLARKMCGYSDAALDDLVASKGKSTHNSDMSMIRSALISWDVEYKNIGSKLDSARLGFAKKKMGLVTLRDDLAKKGFTVDPIDMPNITDGVNPMETLSGIERASRITDGSIMALSAIPSYYDSVKGCASDLKKCLENAKSGYSGASARYADIFGKALSVDVPKTEQGVGELAQSFYEAYAQKDIPKIRSLDSDSKTILSSLM